MLPEPSAKQAIAFFDGQNLFHCAKKAFGYTHPNYDPLALARQTCAKQNWNLKQVRFYTGVPNASDNELWHGFWTKKLLAMRRQGIVVYSRPLKYRNKKVRLPDGTDHVYLAADEKGIDVRIALDVLRMAYARDFDVALVFSQDQDLSEVAAEIRTVAKRQNRWIKMACAFPHSPTVPRNRGIEKTDWIRIDRSEYEACIDPRDYRPTLAAKPPSN
ncbi:MAG: NYN domain-containing protein [Planctomycetes bacterium]|nr:NYN domain-containing protein [Planctomycetota bacterium]